MYDSIKNLILKVLKTPPVPETGGNASSPNMVFRSSYNFFRYRFYLWVIKNAFGIATAAVAGTFAAMEITGKVDAPHTRIATTGIVVVIIAIVVLYSLLQTLISYFALRLDYELRYYRIGSHDLTIREGIANVREMTMSFNKIQNIEIVQGPLQRFFGIADLRVESAGGGITETLKNQSQPAAANFHAACFRGIDNAVELRDLMRAKIKNSRDTGLGNPRESSETTPPGNTHDTLVAIRDEAAALRRAAEAAQLPLAK